MSNQDPKPELTLQEMRDRVERMEQQMLRMSARGLDVGAASAEGGFQSIPEWIPAQVVAASHSFKVTESATAGSVDVAAGRVYQATNSGNVISALTLALAATATNRIYLRLLIESSFNDITLTDETLRQYTHGASTVDVISSTSNLSNTFTLLDATTGYKYIPIANVVTVSGAVTDIYQNENYLRSDYFETAAGVTWVEI